MQQTTPAGIKNFQITSEQRTDNILHKPFSVTIAPTGSSWHGEAVDQKSSQTPCGASIDHLVDNDDPRDAYIDDLDDGDGGDDDPAVCTPGSEHTGRWTRKEHELFLEALKKYGREWKKVASMVKTRTVVQTRTHAQKYFQRFSKYGGVGASEDELGPEGPFIELTSIAGNSSGAGKRSVSIKRPRRSEATSSSSVLKKSTTVAISDKVELALSDEVEDENESGGEELELESTPGTTISIFVPPLPENFPQPSPAACGKRKQAELTAAEMLAASSTQEQDAEGAELLSMMKKYAYKPGEIVRGKRSLPTLSIINPDTLPNSSASVDRTVQVCEPETPWESQVRALEVRADHAGGPIGKFGMSVATPSEQKGFMGKIRECIREGRVEDLEKLLQTAETSTLAMMDQPVFPSPPISISEGKQTEFVFKISGMQDGRGEGSSGEKKSAGTAASPCTVGGLDAKIVTETPMSQKAPQSSVSTSKLKTSSVLGKTLNRPNSRGRSILIDACSVDGANLDQDATLEVCRILIFFGCNTSASEPQQRNTALHIVAARGFEKVGRLLLNNGCLVNALNSDNDTALHIAARDGHGLFIEMLADFGANCHIRNLQCRAAIDVAGTGIGSKEAEDASTSTESGSTVVAADSSRISLRRIMLSAEPRLRTLVLFHEDCLEHSPRRPSDWEGPDRLRAIMLAINDRNEFPEYTLEISNQFEKARVELLQRVHSAEYIAFVDSLSKQVLESDVPGGQLLPFTPQVQKVILHQPYEQLKLSENCDTTFSAGTLRAARRAAGAVAHAVDHVLLGRNRNAFCVVRPPGHHAGYEGLLDGAKSCGFCIFNSVAAGALHALESHNCDRVAIIDLDIHHGNGTEDIVRRYPFPSRLFFFSLHLFEKDQAFEFFPGSGGIDDTVHNIINVPLTPMWQTKKSPTLSVPSAGTRSSTSISSQDGGGLPGTGSSAPEASQVGKDLYRQAIVQRLLPSLRAFNPSLILLSMGFDAAAGDVGNTKSQGLVSPERGMDLEPEDFEWVTTEVLKVADLCCGGRVVSVLEGGYGEYNKQIKPVRPPPQQRVTRGNASAPVQSALPPVDSIMNRDCLAISAKAHLHRLVDPYG